MVYEPPGFCRLRIVPAPRGQGYQHGHLAEGSGCLAPLCLVGTDESFQTGPITEHLQLTIPCWTHLQGSQVVSESQGQGQGHRSGYRESATINQQVGGKTGVEVNVKHLGPSERVRWSVPGGIQEGFLEEAGLICTRKEGRV